MTMVTAVAWMFGVSAAAWWLTGRVLRYARATQMLDVPNERSSHSVVTPRGGGAAIVIATITALSFAAYGGWLPWWHVWHIAGPGLLVAAMGFADDRRHLRRRWRMLGHVVAAIWLLVWLRGLPPIDVFGVAVDLGWAGDVLAALYVVWLINLTNFMDGIDGIAALETITVTLGAAFLAVLTVADIHWVPFVVLAGAAAGFLVWNWPPAKIFMGDVGSGFLGFALAAFSLQTAWSAPTLFWSWVILLGVFIVDATVTLLRRALAGEPVHEAHSVHAYQHATRKCRAHKPVALGVAAVNLFWLLPLAGLAAVGTIDGLAALLIAYTPLVVAALWLRSGVATVNSSSALGAGEHV